MASPMKCIHTDIHGLRIADYLKCRILQHFLAKLDARKSDDSNRGAIQSLAGQ